MKQRQERQLRAAIHQVLIQDWDPLHVRGNPLAQDEYDSYVSGVLRLLVGGASEQRIRDHLRQLETVGMGLSAAGRPAPAEAARRLWALSPEADPGAV